MAAHKETKMFQEVKKEISFKKAPNENTGKVIFPCQRLSHQRIKYLNKAYGRRSDKKALSGNFDNL